MSPSRRSRLDAVARRLLAESAAEHEAQHALLARRMRDRSRRMLLGARQRKAVVGRVAARVGFDLATIAALHARDYATCRKQVAAQRQAVRAQIRRRMSEQRNLLRHVLERRERFERRTGNPVTNICVWRTTAAPTATVRTDTTPSIGSVTTDPDVEGTSPVAGTNRVTLGAVCNGQGLLTVRTHHRFEATAPHDGILSATGFFTPVGSYELAAAGSCFGAPGLSIIDLRARIKIRVRSSAGDLFLTPNPAFSPIVHDQTDAGCEADGAAGAFNLDADAFEMARPRVMNVVSGDRIIVIAEYQLLVLTSTLDGAAGASADVDLSSAGHSLNVPVVLMTVED